MDGQLTTTGHYKDERQRDQLREIPLEGTRGQCCASGGAEIIKSSGRKNHEFRKYRLIVPSRRENRLAE